MIDTLAILLVRSGVSLLFGHDLREAVARNRAHAGGRGECAPRDDGAELDELAGWHVERAKSGAVAGDRHVASDVDRMAPRTEDFAGGDYARGQAPQRLLPLRAPHLHVDVDDIVVGDRDTAEAIPHLEGSKLVGRLVVPDDPRARTDQRCPEGSRRVGAAEIGAATGAIRAPTLADADVVDPLAASERDLAVAAAERPTECVRDLLGDEQAAVGANLNVDVRLRERERLRIGETGGNERRDRGREENATASEERAHRRRGELPGRLERLVHPAGS